MKPIYYFILIFLTISQVSLAQEISLKYGKITEDELKMSAYDRDTTASAVVLYEKGETYYTYNSTSGFQIVFELGKKIKILKAEGVEYGDISIPYFVESNTFRDWVSNIEAYSYNQENGATVKTKLDKKYIFDEEINSSFRQIKFSIPNIKVGTVIEYKYKNVSDRFQTIPDWNVQTDIPVMNSFYTLTIPEYYHFNINVKGYEKIDVQESTKNESFTVSNKGRAIMETSTSRVLKITANNIPALKEEPYIWYVNDFISGIRFELQGVRLPNDVYRPYTTSWEDLEKTLNEKTDFGKNIKISNPYKDEIKSIISESESGNESLIIKKIYTLIKSKIHWNEYYAFWGDNVKDAIKNGTGNNAQINIILISALKDAGIKAYPILMSLRSRGRLPYSHPTINRLNTFIVAAETKEGKIFYMDGSAIYGGLNMLPTNLLVDRARVFEPSAHEKWVNLTNIGKNQQFSVYNCTLDESGLLTCKEESRYMYQNAYALKESIKTEKDSTEYVENLETENGIKIEKVSYTNKEPMSFNVQEYIEFTKQCDTAGDFIYLNPILIAHFNQNPFTQSERKLAIEFSFPYNYSIISNIIIPEGYIVEEIPEPLQITLENNAGTCVYMVKQTDNQIQLSYRFDLNQIIFPNTQYEYLQEFFGQVATKNSQLIVLKKKDLI